MKKIFIVIVVFLVSLSTVLSLDPVTCAFRHTAGGTVQVEVQLIDFSTATNVYPGSGNQHIGNLSSNSNGIISFKVGEGDANWNAITAANITNNHMLAIFADGTVIAFHRLDQLYLEQAAWSEAISSTAFTTSGGVTSNSTGDFEHDDFVFGSPQLDDDGNSDHDKRMFFDKSKAAFRAGVVFDDEWDVDNVGYYTFAAGYSNIARGWYSSVNGGSDNQTRGSHSSIGGGTDNIIYGEYNAISGGSNNITNGLCSAISGGASNQALYHYSTVSGGSLNSVMGRWSVVSGGRRNEAGGYYSTISGGRDNVTSNDSCTVSGGILNTASGRGSNVSGGVSNSATNYYSTVLGGKLNLSSQYFSCILGGHSNTASADYSVVLGGSENVANGQYNIVFGDEVVPTVNENYRIYFFDGSVSGMLALNREDADHPIHVGTNASNGNGAHLTAGGTWTSTSSITKKDRFEDLDDNILNSIMQLPVKKWSYKNTNERHIGPFAEDFYRLFGTGDLNNEDANKYLSTMDVAGVSLRGVQVLIEENKELKSEISEMRKENAEIKEMMKLLLMKIDD